MLGNFLAKDHVLIDPTKVYAPASGNGTPEHLNATLPPDDANADTEFSYLTTDGSDDAPYLDASP